MSFHVPNKYRIREGRMASQDHYGNNGAFQIKHKGVKFMIIASDGMGWEHVSVSLPNRTPSWNEMCYFKDLFWDKDDLVVQFHPPERSYVNDHKHCLHLWRKIVYHPGMYWCPVPDSIMV